MSGFFPESVAPVAWARHDSAVLRDDYVLRQIQEVARMLAAVLERASGGSVERADEDLDEAEEALLRSQGLDRTLVVGLDAGSVARLLRGEPVRLLAGLVRARAQLAKQRGDVARAAGHLRRAIALREAAALVDGITPEDERELEELDSLAEGLEA